MNDEQVRRGHDETRVRHFRGLDDEILRERRLAPKGRRRRPSRLTKQNDPECEKLLAAVRESETVVLGVEKIRLFNADNHETTQFCFESTYNYGAETERIHLEVNHGIRLQVINATTEPGSTVTTVSFIPGEVNLIQYSEHVLSRCWQDELDTLCAALVGGGDFGLRHVHLDTKLCTGLNWSLNIDQLLRSPLQEISLSGLDKNGWRALAAGLLNNQTLRVLTVPYDRRNINTFLQQGGESWTSPRQTTMKTLCISLPKDFPREGDAQAVASILHQVRSVSTFVIEYQPPEYMPELQEFANCIRQSLARAPNVRNLHLLVPFRSKELRDPIVWMTRTLSCLVLVSDLWSRKALKDIPAMLTNSLELEILGLRRQDPQRGRNFLKRLLRLEITKADIVKWLLHGEADTVRMRTLTVRGRERADVALDGRLTQQANLLIKLSDEGLALKDAHDFQVAQALDRESDRLTTTGLSPSTQELSRASESGTDTNGGSHVMSLSGLPPCIVPSACASMSGSSVSDLRIGNSVQVECGSQISDGSGFLCPAPKEHRALRLSTLQHQQQEQEQTMRHRGPQLRFTAFPIAQIMEATENFHPENVIGGGGFGQVFHGKLALPDGSMVEVAVKDLNLEDTNRVRVLKSFETEVETLGRLHHRNLVQLLGFCIDDRRRLLVYKFMPNSSLDYWIFRDGAEEVKLPWRTRVSIAEGMVRGLCFLHFDCEPPILHLDIKPQNILLDGKMNPKLADFGIAKLTVDSEEHVVMLTRAQGTECYMAPEIINGTKRVTTRSDVYSLGLVLMELVRARKNLDMRDVDPDSSLTFPLWAREMFRSGQYQKVYDQLKHSVVSPLVPGYKESEAQRMMSIAIACINEDMAKRPEMRAVLDMLTGKLIVPDPSLFTPTIRYDWRFYEADVRKEGGPSHK